MSRKIPFWPSLINLWYESNDQKLYHCKIYQWYCCSRNKAIKRFFWNFLVIKGLEDWCSESSAHLNLPKSLLVLVNKTLDPDSVRGTPVKPTTHNNYLVTVFSQEGTHFLKTQKIASQRMNSFISVRMHFSRETIWSCYQWQIII